jgi:large-conductance mechanosensitive channel
MGILRDIRSFVSSRDLLVFAIGVALSNQFQITLTTIINSMIMPFVSAVTGPTNLASRSYDLKPPTSRLPAIKLAWGAAVNAAITFFITMVIMVQCPPRA